MSLPVAETIKGWFRWWCTDRRAPDVLNVGRRRVGGVEWEVKECCIVVGGLWWVCLLVKIIRAMCECLLFYGEEDW